MALAESLRALGAGLADAGRQRLALAALDVEDQALRAGQLLAALLAVAVLALLALAALAATVVVLFWDSARIAALAGVSLFFVAGAVLAFWRLQRGLRERPPLLAATLAELRKDVDQLAGRRP